MATTTTTTTPTSGRSAAVEVDDPEAMAPPTSPSGDSQAGEQTQAVSRRRGSGSSEAVSSCWWRWSIARRGWVKVGLVLALVLVLVLGPVLLVVLLVALLVVAIVKAARS